MKIKGFVITGAIISFIGIIVMITSLTLTGFNLKKLYQYEISTKETQIVDEINNVEIDFNYIGVSIIKQDVLNITINHFESKYSSFDINLDGQSLIIRENVIKKMPWYRLGISLGTKNNPIVEIIIPNSYTIDSNVKTNYGDINYCGTFNDTLIECKAGNVDLSGSIYNNLNAKINYGLINLDNTFINDCLINMDAGKVSLNCCSANTFICNNKTGEVMLNSLSANKVVIDVKAGDVDIKSLISSNIQLSVDTGKIDASIIGIKSEYTIIVNKKTGSANINSQIGSSEKKLNVDVDAGEIDIYFI